MRFLFRDRIEGGELLAGRLGQYRLRRDLLIVAIPRGGLPVGSAVALRLGRPLDVLPVRKLVLRRYWDIAVGAVCPNNPASFDPAAIREAGVDPVALEALTARGVEEVIRQERFYRDGRKPLSFKGRVVILTDDGVATGLTLRVAADFCRRSGASRIVIATPIISRRAFPELRRIADEIVAIIVPAHFESVAEWYRDFTELSEEDAKGCLDAACNPQGGKGC